MESYTAHSEEDEDRWLDSESPWSSDTSSLSHSSDIETKGVKVDESFDTLSTLQLPWLTELLRIISIDGLEQILPSRIGWTRINLGEGETYTVEQNQLRNSIKPEDFTWVAIKCVKSTTPKDLEESIPTNIDLMNKLGDVRRELEILSHPPLRRHPNVIQLLGCTWEEDTPGCAPMLVMELANMGSLNALLLRMYCQEPHLIAFCADAASGLAALHASGIAHGDLKLENVLVGNGWRERLTAKISDFGQASFDDDELQHRGTPVYNVPEFQIGQRIMNIDSSCDLPLHLLAKGDTFAYGLLAFEVFNHGKRYYNYPQTERFRYALLEDLQGPTNTVEVATVFASVTEWQFPDLKSACLAIFEQTLQADPAKRLPRGWGAILGILGFHDSVIDKPQNLLKHQTVAEPYSILRFSDQFFGARVMLGKKLWNELSSLTTDYHSDDIKGKASFDLFLLDISGRYAPLNDEDKTLDLLATSARHGYYGAFIIGKRVFEANHQSVPTFIKDGPKGADLRRMLRFLERLPSNEFYANAVRLLWTADLRSRALDSLNIPRHCRSREPIRHQVEEHRDANSENFRETAKTNFWLHIAVIQNDEQTIKDLAQAGCDINTQTLDGLTPLHLACRIASTSLIRLLLSYGANASLNDLSNISPIHWIILLPKHEIPEIADLLAQNGAKMRASLSRGRPLYLDKLGLAAYGTPLSWACASRNVVAVEKLLSLGKQVGRHSLSKDELLYDDQFMYMILGLLCSDILDVIVKEGYNLRDIWQKEPEKIWYHVGVGEGNDLQRWCIHGQLLDDAYAETIHALIQAGFPFPTCSQNPLDGSMEIIPLHRAAMSFNVALISKYIDLGADVNQRDWQYGHTALHVAIETWEASTARPAKVLKAISTLIERGASLEDEEEPPNHRMSAPNPLHYACSWGAPPCVVSLLANRAPLMVNKKHWGLAPLHSIKSADPIRDQEALRNFHVLLKSGADINLESDHQDITDLRCCYTPVAYHTANSRWKAAELLLDEDCSMIYGVSGGHENSLVHLCMFEGFIDATRSRKRTTESMLQEILNHPKVRSSNLVDHLNYSGCSPIQMAITWSLPHYAKILLEHGCDTRLPSGASVLTLIDEKLKNPPTFVVDERVLVERNSETERLNLMSYSRYRDGLTAIRPMIKPYLERLFSISDITDSRIKELEYTRDEI